MKFFSKGVILLFVSLNLIPRTIKAQDWEYGFSVGTSGYMGEYNPDNIFKFNSLSGSVGAKYNFNSTWGVRASVSILGIKWDDGQLVKGSKTLGELSILPEFNFFKFEPKKTRNAFTSYVFAGIGAVHFKYFKAIPSQIDSIIPSTKAVIPFGAGLKYNLKGALSLNTNIEYRLAITNVLDDEFGGNVWDKNIFKSINNLDSYMTFQIGLTYTFFKQGCPTW